MAAQNPAKVKELQAWFKQLETECLLASCNSLLLSVSLCLCIFSFLGRSLWLSPSHCLGLNTNVVRSRYHPPLFNPPMDVEGYCESIAKHGGWLAPWRTD